MLRMAIALYCEDAESYKEVKKQISLICSVPVHSYDSNREFISAITDRPDLIMMVIQTGSKSIETAMSALGHNKAGKLVWFSDIDFALLSFRLRATYFGLIPVEMDKLKTALSSCGIIAGNEI